MTVEGVDDAEAVLLARIRETVGTDVIVSTSMDMHGNVSRELAHMSDLITCYRMAPHEDRMETKEPAIRVGYAWAHEPRNRAAVVVTGPSEAAVTQGAERPARGFWEARGAFAFVAPTGSLAECLDEALASSPGARPFFVGDTGDNPTAGGAGDVTWGLERVLARPEFKEPSGPTVIYASVPGPVAVEASEKAGVGATVTVTAGAEVDDRHAGPLTMTGVVHAVRHGDRNAGTEVVLRVGSVYVITTRLRKPHHHEHDFTGLALDPRGADVVVVKIGHLEPELFAMSARWKMALALAMSARWKMALAPGGVDQDLVRLGHHRARRPMFPFDPHMPDPDRTARIIPPSNEPLGGPDE
jgi:microcystin degradation protein MlrC